MRFILVLLALCSPLLGNAEFCFFQPPSGWMPADPTSLSPLVKVGFVDPKNFGFRASLNLALEEIDCTLDEYLEAVKQIHSSDRHNDWAYLGKFPTKGGQAALTQIDTHSSWGPVRMLQLILVRDKKAYILTAAASKKEFPLFLRSFKASLGSLTFTENLFSAISDEKKRTQLVQLKNSSLKGDEKAWENFQNEVLHDCKELGAHWQSLVLAESIKERSSLN